MVNASVDYNNNPGGELVQTRSDHPEQRLAAQLGRLDQAYLRTPKIAASEVVWQRLGGAALDQIEDTVTEGVLAAR